MTFRWEQIPYNIDFLDKRDIKTIVNITQWILKLETFDKEQIYYKWSIFCGHEAYIFWIVDRKPNY